MARQYHRFEYKKAAYRISEHAFPFVCTAIRKSRDSLDQFIKTHPSFAESLVPITLPCKKDELPQIMMEAGTACGVGPMAAVAGAIAERATSFAIMHGAEEAIVENGGDLSIVCTSPVLVAVEYMQQKSSQLAFHIVPEQTPLAICSSSSRMGHSLSFGDCDLATVVSKNAALADAAATAACNMVTKTADIERALNQIIGIDGIDGALIAKDGDIGLVGTLPEIVRHGDPEIHIKTTRS